MNTGNPSDPMAQAVAALLEQERKRKARRDRQFRTAEGWLFNIGLLVQGNWLLMILVGIIHADWIPTLPTISFKTSGFVFIILFWICVTVGTIGPGPRGRS